MWHSPPLMLPAPTHIPPFSVLQGGGFRGSLGGRAFAAAVLGWFVFPLPCAEEEIGEAVARATNEPADIYQQWGSGLEGDHAFGVACGPSELLVVECSAQVDLDAFLRHQGLSPAPMTTEVRFGSHRHLYYSTYGLSLDPAPALLQVGGEVGYGSAVCVIGAGSHYGGEYYEYAPGHAPDEVPVAALPRDWTLHVERLNRRLRCEGASGGEGG